MQKTPALPFAKQETKDTFRLSDNFSSCSLLDKRPFPSSPQSLFKSESKCEIFVMVTSFNFNMTEN